MSAEEFSVVAEKVKGQAYNYYLHVMGEPLMHTALEEILNICNDKGMSVTLTTNGTLLCKNKELLRRSACLRKINISLHSYKQNGGSRENFQDFLREIKESAGFISEGGKPAVNFRLWDNETVEHFDKTGYTRIKEGYTLSVEKEFVWPSEEKEPDDSCEAYCLGLKSHVAVLSDGSVVPCCLDSDGEMTLGNIFTSSLRECISSPRAVNIKTAFANKKSYERLCRKCTYRKRFTSSGGTL